MGLFQKSVISKYLKTQNKENLAAKWTIYRAYFLNLKVQEEIKSLKEEQYQGEFLDELFVKILGYTKPASSSETKFNITTEYKNVKDSKKADGAIIIDDKVKAVIELKGTNTTDLGKIEVQAFGYKNNQPECVYVITSNFEKLRLYIDNAIEHVEFNLFALTEEEFQLLYLCLGFDNLSHNIAKKIKEDSLSEEDLITKKLYKDYSLFKRELHQNLVELNPDYDPLVLFKKSQKLLDRFLFLFFGEDRHLLPPNSVRLILTQWNQLRELDEYTPLYVRFKKYFGYLNTGHKGKQHDVFAYNGGLFKPDEVLDTIKIDDNILFKHTLKLSEYDFASEVDVNILGHIFENSLNELDEIKAQFQGQEIDKTKTKRKKDGIFYTPKYITKYIVENTVGKLCEEKKTELLIVEEEYFTDKKRTKTTKLPLLEKLEIYRKWLLQLTICDPACGSGAFLNQALDFLITEHRYVDELQAKLFGDAMVLSDIENSILENNLFGVDLNEESVEIAKLSLWLRTAQPNRKLNDLSNNIKCGNSLIDDPKVAGEKAFNWQKEFPQVFGAKKDIGIELVDQHPIDPDYLALLEVDAKEAAEKANQAIALSKEAIELSEKAAALSLKVYEYAQKLQSVSEPQKQYGINKGGFDVVIGNPPYLSLTKGNTSENTLNFYINLYDSIKNANSKNLFTLFNEISTKLVKDKGLVSFIIPEGFLKTRSYDDCVKKMNEVGTITKAVYFEDWVFEDATTGSVIFEFIKNKQSNFVLQEFLVTKNKEVVRIESKNNPIIEKYKKLDFKSVSELCDTFKGMAVQNRQNYIFKEKYNLPNRFLLGNCIDRYSFKDEFYCDYTKLVIVGGTKNKEKQDISPRILIRRTGNFLCCVMLNEPALTESTLYSCSVKSNEIDIYYLLSVLNSKFLTYVVRENMITNEQAFPQILMTDIQLLKIPNTKETNQLILGEKSKFIELKQVELQSLAQKFQRTIQRKFELVELPKKLQDWYLISYADFIKELAKKKVKLSLSEEAEWEDYFLLECKKALELKATIDATDKAIDSMVYELYGLTNEEIALVEQT